MNRGELGFFAWHSFSVVVDDLNVLGISIDPFEAEAPALIDSNAVLAAAITDESFQMVAGDCSQLVRSRWNNLAVSRDRNDLITPLNV